MSLFLLINLFSILTGDFEIDNTNGAAAGVGVLPIMKVVFLV